MAQSTSTPTVQQQRVQPAAGVYQIDKSHSMVEFVSRHLMVTKVRGRFTEFSGAITVGETPEESSVGVTIDAVSVDTGDEKRDAHLRSADFLDVENHPTLEFRSTDVEVVDDERLRVTGDLTIRGVTRPVELTVEFDGVALSPWGQEVIAFTARTEFDREDFGMTWNQALETGGVLVGKKVSIEISVQAVRQA